MSDSIEELLREISKAEDEENSDLFLLQLYFENKKDLSFFTPQEEEKIKKCLAVLMKDTAKHQELLREAAEELVAKPSQEQGLLEKLKALPPARRSAVPWIETEERPVDAGSLEHFLRKVTKAEDEEESDLFLLNLHLRNQIDYDFFSKAEEQKIKELLTVLIHETAKHKKWLGQIHEELTAKD